MTKKGPRIDAYIAKAAEFARPILKHIRKVVHAAWITDAKRDETRQRRIATAIKWIAAGKSRNWKYQKK